VTAELFPLLSVPPIAGRYFLPSEDKPGENAVTVLSEVLWRRRFAGDPSAIGRSITLSGRPYTIVGVAPHAITTVIGESQLWVPMAFDAKEAALYPSHNLRAFGRLRPGAPLAKLPPIWTASPHSSRRPFPARTTAGACSSTRFTSISCGTSGRRGLVQAMLTESLLLSLFAGVAGLLVAAGILRGLTRLAPTTLPRASGIGLNAEVVAFTMALATIAPLVFGLLPALQVSRTDLRESLTAGGRSVRTTLRTRTRAALVIGQISLAILLLVGCALLVRSFGRLLDVNPGFNPRGAVVLGLQVPPRNILRLKIVCASSHNCSSASPRCLVCMRSD
jgi:putative ABC transport system permease protein